MTKPNGKVVGKGLNGQCFLLLDFIIFEWKSWQLVRHIKSELTNTDFLVPEIHDYLSFIQKQLLGFFNEHCLCQKCTKTENKPQLYMSLHLSLGHYSITPISVNGTGLYSHVNTLNVVCSLDRNKNSYAKYFYGFC